MAALFTLISVPATFDISGRSEILEVTISNPVRWHLDKIVVAATATTSRTDFSGTFEPSIGSTVSFQRISDGPLHVVCEAKQDSQQAGSLVTDDGQDIKAEDRIVFLIGDVDGRLKAGRNLVFPIVGEITIGEDLPMRQVRSSPLLKSGTIRILGRALLGESLYQGGSFELSAGDRVAAVQPRGSSFGSVGLDGSEGLGINVRMISNAVSVVRFGSEGYQLRVALVERLKNDPGLQLVWVLYGGFAALISWWTKKDRKTKE